MHLTEPAQFHVSRDGGPTQVLTFGPGALTAECIQASIDGAIGPGAVTVRTGANPVVRLLPPYGARPEEHWTERRSRMTSDGPTARRFHALGCRWLPKAHRWSCADTCEIPVLIEQEAAEDE